MESTSTRKIYGNDKLVYNEVLPVSVKYSSIKSF